MCPHTETQTQTHKHTDTQKHRHFASWCASVYKLQGRRETPTLCVSPLPFPVRAQCASPATQSGQAAPGKVSSLGRLPAKANPHRRAHMHTCHIRTDPQRNKLHSHMRTHIQTVHPHPHSRNTPKRFIGTRLHGESRSPRLDHSRDPNCSKSLRSQGIASCMSQWSTHELSPSRSTS